MLSCFYFFCVLVACLWSAVCFCVASLYCVSPGAVVGVVVDPGVALARALLLCVEEAVVPQTTRTARALEAEVVTAETPDHPRALSPAMASAVAAPGRAAVLVRARAGALGPLPHVGAGPAAEEEQ